MYNMEHKKSQENFKEDKPSKIGEHGGKKDSRKVICDQNNIYSFRKAKVIQMQIHLTTFIGYSDHNKIILYCIEVQHLVNQRCARLTCMISQIDIAQGRRM